jgi:hypothetical protein
LVGQPRRLATAPAIAECALWRKSCPAGWSLLSHLPLHAQRPITSRGGNRGKGRVRRCRALSYVPAIVRVGRATRRSELPRERISPLAHSCRAKWLWLTQFLALLHYASGLALVAATTGLGELARLERALRLAPEFIVTWATVYLIGQAVLWWRTSKRGQSQPTVQ